MKSKLFAIMACILPFMASAVELETEVHYHIAVQHPMDDSHMRVSGNIYGYIPGTPYEWSVRPNVFLNANDPVDFSTSIGLRCPVGPFILGYHAAGHFHNFGKQPVNQFSHTLEIFHDICSGMIHYHAPTSKSGYFCDGSSSAHRLEAEASYRIRNMGISAGPIFLLDDKRWGAMARVAYKRQSNEYGIEIVRAPSQSQPNVALFTTLKFPVRK